MVSRVPAPSLRTPGFNIGKGRREGNVSVDIAARVVLLPATLGLSLFLSLSLALFRTEARRYSRLQCVRLSLLTTRAIFICVGGFTLIENQVNVQVRFIHLR